MAKCSRVIHHEDGTVSPSDSKYNGKYILGNLLVCGDCGASYRRRTERGRVVWRCATRIEKGKEACAESPTINEEWLKETLADTLAGGVYDEVIMRDRIEKISVHQKFMTVRLKNGEESIINI